MTDFAIEAERSVIGAILVRPEIMPEAVELLEESDFYAPEHRTIYRTMEGYFVDGKPIDVVTISFQHEEYKALLAEAALSVPSTLNWKSYAKIVRDNAIRARASEHASALVGALAVSASVAECQELAVSACEALSQTIADNTVSAKDGFYQFYTSLQKPSEYIRTGFASLDRRTYIQPGDFVVVGARPSVGKTALTLQLMLHMAKEHRCVYFSLETGRRNLFGRMSANLGGISMAAIKSQDGLNFAKLSATGKLFDGLDFHVVEAAGWTVPEIKAKAVQLQAEVVFVDYLGLVKSEGKSLYERATNTSLALRTMAQSSKMAIIAACQLNRDGKGIPDMTHLRDSGQIEQDADVIMFLHAPNGINDPDEYKVRERVLIIDKNKEGQTGAINLDFDGSTMRFCEIVRYRNE